MIILGINFGHDSAAALIKDGEIINAIEEEKISRKKQDFGWPNKAIEKILKQNKIKKSDINHVVFGSQVYDSLNKFEIEYRFNKNRFSRFCEISYRILCYLKLGKYFSNVDKNRLIEKQVLKKGYKNAKVQFLNHHLCHAITAYYCSPKNIDLVVTADGHGDGHSFNFYTKQKDAIELTCIKSNSYKTSIGQFYSAITTILGFRATRHEGKITGLAAFGNNTELVDLFSSLFSYKEGRLIRYPYTNKNTQVSWGKIKKSLGFKERVNYAATPDRLNREYDKNGILLRNHLKMITNGYSKEDIAYACQHVSENVILEEFDKVIKKFFKKKKLAIGLAGGVFANVRINQKIFEHGNVKNIFVQPAMGDAGLALGAAIKISLEHNADIEKFCFSHTFYGPNYKDRLDSLISLNNNDLNFVKMTEPAKHVAKLLSENKIIGFWSGNMEWGPRALGSRSILLNTFDKNVNSTLNDRLNRTEFMPFAPAVIDYMSKVYFPKYEDGIHAADYMTITYDVDPEYHDLLQAVVHVDGTARPQIVKKEVTPYYYDIIDEFYKITKCGAIVNTSFNAHEEPIVNTPEAAINNLLTDRVDLLVLENYLVSKK